MILFKEDWEKHPSAFPNVHTRNKSFIDLAIKYKMMGVSNNKFLLALHDYRLMDIDPHNPNLSQEEIGLILAECDRNLWYFMREVVRIPQKGGDSIPLIANRANIGATWALLAGMLVYLEQIRQTGKTILMATIINYIISIYGRNSTANLLTKDDNLRVKTMADIRAVAEELPPYMQLRTGEDTYNMSEMSIGVLKNNLKIHVPQASIKGADKVGRGFTSEWGFGDEIAYITNAEISIPVMLSAGTAARNSARRNGRLYGTLLASTSGKLNDPDGKYAYTIIQSCAPFTEHLYDAKDHDDLSKVVRTAGRGFDRVYISFNHRQMGYSDEWLRRAIDESLSKGAGANRDFFNIWEVGTESHPLEKEVLEVISQSKTEPVFTEITGDSYTLNWYIPKDDRARMLSQTPHIITLDTSEGIGADDYGLTILNADDGSVVAAGVFNHVDSLKFIPYFADFLLTYPAMVGVIERKSTGSVVLRGVIDILLKNGHDPFTRLFNQVVNEPHEHPTEWEALKTSPRFRGKDFYNKSIKLFGFVTSGSGPMSRASLYGEVFWTASNEYGHLIKDPTLVKQIEGLVEKNNRIDHNATGNDDLVVAYLLGMWFLMRGNNLKHYKINPLSVLTKTSALTNTKNGQTPGGLLVERLLVDQLQREIDIYHGQKNKLLKQLSRQKIDRLVATMQQKKVTPRNLESLLLSLEGN